MKAPAQSTVQRAALRSFIRSQEGAAALLDGRKVNDLTMEELRTMTAALGGDAAAIANAPQPDTAATEEALRDAEENPGPAPRQDKAQDKGEEKQLAAIRDLIVNGGFTAADPALRKLISDANKPAEIIEVPIGAPGKAAPVTHARPTQLDVQWNKLFGVKGPMGKRTSRLWDGAHAFTPAKDDGYVWPQPATAIALSQLSRGRNVFLFGPPGTGKTAWAMQYAASTGRPYVIIECNDQTDAPTLLGMTVPSPDGGTTWQDGVLTMAIQTPGCVICIDEPSTARAGALIALNNLLAYGFIQVGENGRKVKIAKNVSFIACDNTNGTGDGARDGFIGTGPLNVAFLNRFPTKCRINYLEPDQEAQVIMRHTGCTRELALLLIGVATTTRQDAEKGGLICGIGLRNLFSWAELLTDGVSVREAFESAVLNGAAAQDRQALNQQCLLSYDKAAVAKALDPQGATNDPSNNNPTDAGRNAAEEFTS